MVQWQRLYIPNTEGLGSIPAQGIRFHMPKLKWEQPNKMNKNKFFFKKKLTPRNTEVSSNCPITMINPYSSLKVSMTALLYVVLTSSHFFVIWSLKYLSLGPPQWLSGKESTCQTGDVGLIPGSGRSPGEGNDNSLQYCCLGNPWGEEPGGLQSMGVTKSETWLSD